MSKFNFTSQICTTKEQSERLLAFGLKKETADMAYEYKPKHLADTDIDKDWVIVAHSPCGTDIPAWSLHRLIEMAQLPQSWQCLSGDWYNEIIAHIQSMIHINQFNKDYLEE